MICIMLLVSILITLRQLFRMNGDSYSERRREFCEEAEENEIRLKSDCDVLTNEQIEEIKIILKKGEMSLIEIATKYKVFYATISQINYEISG